jgi:hypothetical protein
MAEVNAAYETLEREERHAAERPPMRPMGPGVSAPVAAAAPAASTFPAPGPARGSLLGRILAANRIDTPALDFGEYAGWKIAEVAERDPRYLRWLSRHSSGVRFRSIIEQVLGPDPELGRRAAILD